MTSRERQSAPARRSLAEVRRRERDETWRLVLAWVGFLAATCAGLALGTVAAFALATVLPTPPAVGIALGIVALAAWGTRAGLRHHEAATRDTRRRAGYCVECGYDLRGSRHADRCPECGALRRVLGHGSPRRP